MTTSQLAMDGARKAITVQYKKNPCKHLIYTDFLMINLSLFIYSYFTSSKTARIDNQ